MPERAITASGRRLVANRARHRCEYCQIPEAFSAASFTVDHILPRGAGGSDALDNLAWACAGCNAAKHVRQTAVDPRSTALADLYNPRRQVWREHFAWSQDGCRINGLTAMGRATAGALALNRRGLVNLREMLEAVGRHPRYGYVD